MTKFAIVFSIALLQVIIIKKSCHINTKCSAAAAAKLLQLCLTLWDPVDGSPPGSSVPRILQARTLEWVSISFSLNALDVPKIDEGVWTFKDYWLNSSLFFWRSSHVQSHPHPKILSFEISKVISFLIINSKYCLSYLHLGFYQRNYFPV